MLFTQPRSLMQILIGSLEDYRKIFISILPISILCAVINSLLAGTIDFVTSLQPLLRFGISMLTIFAVVFCFSWAVRFVNIFFDKTDKKL